MSSTNNARVWDAYNQERPEEPNAEACTRYQKQTTYDNNPRWNAMETAQSVAEDIWRDVRECSPEEFELTVEMPDCSVWTIVVGIEYEPSINVRSASRVDPQGGET